MYSHLPQNLSKHSPKQKVRINYIGLFVVTLSTNAAPTSLNKTWKCYPSAHAFRGADLETRNTLGAPDVEKPRPLIGRDFTEMFLDEFLVVLVPSRTVYTLRKPQCAPNDKMCNIPLKRVRMIIYTNLIVPYPSAPISLEQKGVGRGGFVRGSV